MDAEPYIRRGWCREIARWAGYRTGQKPTIRIDHRKTGAVIDHPLEERLPTGEIVRFYEEAEVVLAKLVRRRVPMILREVEEGVSKPYSFSGKQKIVQRIRRQSACRRSSPWTPVGTGV